MAKSFNWVGCCWSDLPFTVITCVAGSLYTLTVSLRACSLTMSFLKSSNTIVNNVHIWMRSRCIIFISMDDPVVMPASCHLHLSSQICNPQQRTNLPF
jgi:hypothetical protein